ncbi:MAG: ATPase, partial [Chloroflexi bacterium]|nr:ATPase [Chloroflexota bacterium]
MDILHLVDRMEELFNAGKPVPLTRNVMVDENAFMDIIDQMRISIPEEIKKAQQINAQKDRILA